MTREMFEMNSQLNLKVDELAGLKLALRNKDALLQEKEKELREAVEKMSRSERKSSKHHVSVKHECSDMMSVHCALCIILLKLLKRIFSLYTGNQ